MQDRPLDFNLLHQLHSWNFTLEQETIKLHSVLGMQRGFKCEHMCYLDLSQD